MFAVIIILFMIVGFTLCGLWAHSGTAKQRHAEAAAAEAAAQRRQQQEQQRTEARQKRQQEAEQKQQEAEAKRQQAEQRRQARRAQQEADRAAKLEAAREMAELKERQLAAARELVRVQMMAYERRGTISVDDTADAEAPQTPPEDAQEAPTAAQAVTLEEFAAAHAEPAQEAAQAVTDAPKPFAGQAVAFTGRLSRSGMTRREAAEKVRQAGGRAYDKGMPAGTTLLVVGDKPGMCKLDKADEWIGQVRKITEAQFLEMFAA
ncbi:MAG: BRCT domain-containing protein [Clostridia bacterium]|nr:BRCT domain-containing protein [Clostridia bacterium]